MIECVGNEMLAVDVGRVCVPLHAWLADTEPIGIHEWGIQVDAFELLAVLRVIHPVQPRCGRKKVRMRASPDLRLRPAATCHDG